MKRMIVVMVALVLAVRGCAKKQNASDKTAGPYQASTRALVRELESNNVTSVGSQCYRGMQRQSATWVPATAKALNRQFGRSKGIALISTSTPAEGWLEHVWDVRAERRDYQMRVQYISGRIGHMEFRSSSDQPWTHVTSIALGQAIK